jgi:hypothetical protein
MCRKRGNCGLHITRYFNYLKVDWMIILKWMERKYTVKKKTGLKWLRIISIGRIL